MKTCEACGGKGYARPFAGTGSAEQRPCGACQFDRWWEPRRPDEPVTAAYLARVLRELGAENIAARAELGHFDDYFAPPEVADGAELHHLVRELWSWSRGAPRLGRDRSKHVIAAVKLGEFDGTQAESARWQASADGQAALAALVPGMFGGNA